MQIRPFLAKLGVVGTLFFLIKGLMWLIIPAIIVALR